jgi:hypothetical protein
MQAKVKKNQRNDEGNILLPIRAKDAFELSIGLVKVVPLSIACSTT